MESGVVLGSRDIQLQQEPGGVQESWESSLWGDMFNGTLVFGTGLGSGVGVLQESEKVMTVTRLKAIPNS